MKRAIILTAVLVVGLGIAFTGSAAADGTSGTGGPALAEPGVHYDGTSGTGGPALAEPGVTFGVVYW